MRYWALLYALGVLVNFSSAAELIVDATENGVCPDGFIMFDVEHVRHEFVYPLGIENPKKMTYGEFREMGLSLRVYLTHMGGQPVHKTPIVYEHPKKGNRTLCFSLQTAETMLKHDFDLRFSSLPVKLNKSFGVDGLFVELPFAGALTFRNEQPLYDSVVFDQKNDQYSLMMKITQRCPFQLFGYLCQRNCKDNCRDRSCSVANGVCKEPEVVKKDKDDSTPIWMIALFVGIPVVGCCCLTFCCMVLWKAIKKKRSCGRHHSQTSTVDDESREHRSKNHKKHKNHAHDTTTDSEESRESQKRKKKHKGKH